MINFPFANRDPSEVSNKQMASMNNPNKEINKRLKCFQSLYKQFEHSPKTLTEIFNGYYYAIFEILYYSIIRLTSGYEDVKALFSVMKQLFESLDKDRIKAIIVDHGLKIYSLLYFTLDFFTRKEVRLLSFGILLRIIDAFITDKNADKPNPNFIPEKQPFEKQAFIEKTSEKSNLEKDLFKLPTELHEFFLISIEFNLYQQKSLQGLTVLPFQENSKLYIEEEKLLEIKNGEWMRLIKDNNPVFGMEEIMLKEFFHFTKCESRIKNWFTLLQLTWLKKIFETTRDRSKISPSKSYLSMSSSLEPNEDPREAKKSILVIHFTPNIFPESVTKIIVQKVFLKTFKSYLKILSQSINPNNYMNEENFRILMKIISEMYYAEDCHLIITKIQRISRVKPVLSPKGDKYLSPVLPVVSESPASQDVLYIELLNNIQQSILTELDIIEKKCLNARLERTELLNEILRYMLEDEECAQELIYRHVLEISLNVLKKMDKPNISIQANIDTLSPFLKNILLYAIKLEASFTPSWKKIKEYFHKFLTNRDLMNDFTKILLDETEKLVKMAYNEELFSIFRPMIVNEGFRFRPEYLLQLLLHVHWKSKTHKCFDKSVTEHPLTLTFEPDYTEFLKNASPKEILTFEKTCHRFNGWLHLMKLFIETQKEMVSPYFDTLCDGIANVAEHLLLPEQFFQPAERGKPLPKPKYNPPAQTLLLIFENFFKSAIGYPLIPEENKTPKRKHSLESVLFAYKTFFKIFCEARSELLLPKGTIVGFIKLVIDILGCDWDRIKEDEEKKMSIEICLIYTSKLFSLEMPGIKLLIPYYFEAINHILAAPHKDFLCKKSHNELSISCLLRVTRTADLKAFADLLKSACLTLLKSIYGVIKRFADLEIGFKGKIVKLRDYKLDILKFIQCVVFEYETNLQLKLKNNTPTISKKNKDDYIEDSQDFKTNFFGFVLYIIKDLVQKEDLDVFKTIWEGIMKIMGNDVHNTDHYCVLCTDVIDAVSFLGHELVQDPVFDFYNSAIECMLTILNNTQDIKVKIKTLNSLLGWIINDCNYQINSKPKLFDKISLTLRNSMKSEENSIKENVEVFFLHLVANFYNFPPRNQTIDNNKSLFNETALYYDVIDTLGDLAQTENPYKPPTLKADGFLRINSSSSKGAARQQNARRVISKSFSEKKPKAEKDCSPKTPIFLLCSKIGLKRGVAYNERRMDDQLCGKSIQEEIHRLNQKIGNNYPDNLEFPRISLSIGNHTILSFVKGSKNTLKVIVRNVSGKYAWVIKLFDAIGSDCIQKKYDEKGLEFKMYKNLLVQQEGGVGPMRTRAGTQTQDLSELRTFLRRPEKYKAGKILLMSVKSAENIDPENDFSQTLKEIILKIEDFNQFDKNHEVDFSSSLNNFKKKLLASESEVERTELNTIIRASDQSQIMSRNSKELKKKKNSVWEHTSSIFYGVRCFLIQNGYTSMETLKTIRIIGDNKTKTEQFQNLLNVLDQTSSPLL